MKVKIYLNFDCKYFIECFVNTDRICQFFSVAAVGSLTLIKNSIRKEKIYLNFLRKYIIGCFANTDGIYQLFFAVAGSLTLIKQTLVLEMKEKIYLNFLRKYIIGCFANTDGIYQLFFAVAASPHPRSLIIKGRSSPEGLQIQ